MMISVDIDNSNSTNNIDLISIYSNNNINQIIEEPFPFIPFNEIDITAKNTFENSKETLSFKDSYKEKKSKNNTKFIIKKLKGRKRKRGKKEGSSICKYTHDKLGSDNILRKIQVHYISFIIQFANAILIKFGYDDLFIRIDYKLKKIVNKDYLSFIKKLTIGEILCWDSSPKFKVKGKDYNRNIFFEAIKNPIINKIFCEKYLSLFRNVYYENRRIINLDKYGLNDCIKLSVKKVKMYKELLEKKEIENDENKNEYIKKIADSIDKNFLSIVE